MPGTIRTSAPQIRSQRSVGVDPAAVAEPVVEGRAGVAVSTRPTQLAARSEERSKSVSTVRPRRSKVVAGTRFEPASFSYESMSRAWFRRLVKSERLNFSSGTEVQITVAERYRRLIVLLLQLRILREPCVRPFLFYAIVADFHTRSVPLLQTRMFGFDELAPQSVWSSAGNTTADQEAREPVDRNASIRTCKPADLSE